MARPLCIEYEGAAYHITSRGNARKDLFLDEEWLKFFKVLEDVVERYNWICHAYCLMPNHYHLLLETPAGNLFRVLLDGERHWQTGSGGKEIPKIKI